LNTIAADDRRALRAADRAPLGNKNCTTRLGSAVLLKVFAVEGRFPRCPITNCTHSDCCRPYSDVPGAV